MYFFFDFVCPVEPNVLRNCCRLLDSPHTAPHRTLHDSYSLFFTEIALLYLSVCVRSDSRLRSSWFGSGFRTQPVPSTLNSAFLSLRWALHTCHLAKDCASSDAMRCRADCAERTRQKGSALGHALGGALSRSGWRHFPSGDDARPTRIGVLSRLVVGTRHSVLTCRRRRSRYVRARR